MQFVGVDANDRAIFGMQGAQMKSVLTAKDNVVVEFIPITRMVLASKQRFGR